jgi:hypothetical protein
MSSIVTGIADTKVFFQMTAETLFQDRDLVTEYQYVSLIVTDSLGCMPRKIVMQRKGWKESS